MDQWEKLKEVNKEIIELQKKLEELWEKRKQINLGDD